MSKQPVPRALYGEARKALSDLLHYEWPERFALRKVVESGRQGELLEAIFITTAQAALVRHPVNAAEQIGVS
ncbi:MAG: hypothetical protein P8126_12705 [Gammaproteobacteria bacterium]